MAAAAELYVRLRGAKQVSCAKLHRDNPYRCIFCAHQTGKRRPGPAAHARAEDAKMAGARAACDEVVHG
jgi:hypothetical protein